ncbi:MAG TPA: hypothetical protein ENJ18_11080 [Nannocystis exedens]|nr:hypothetical protein [Nannocystis exedens]
MADEERDESTSDSADASNASNTSDTSDTSRSDASESHDAEGDALTQRKSELQSQLDAQLDAEEISLYEYNLRKKAISSGREDALEVELKELTGSEEPTAFAKKPSAWSSEPKRWTSPEGRGDDPDVRIVHAPLAPGIGDGKAFFFLFGLKKSRSTDMEMRDRELENIDDDIETLRNAGYTVVVDPEGTKEDFLQALRSEGEGAEGLAPAGILWSAHGYEDGAIETCDGGTIRPEDIDTARVSADLRLMIFSACYTGSRSTTWRKALGGKPLVVGWGRPVTITRAVDFLTPDPETDTDLDDLIERYLLKDTPLPGEATTSYSPLAAARGRIADLPERIERIANLLRAKWEEQEDRARLQLFVPLPGGRKQQVTAFVIDCAEPFNEGEPLLAIQSEVGELSAIVDPAMLLSGFGQPGYARVALVSSNTDMPNIVTQGFLPLSRVRDRDLAALIYQVASLGDALENRIFGGDMR